MVIVGLLAVVAQAATVTCDPVAARTLVEDARIDERRVASTHPWLVPGLAREAADPELQRAITDLCADGGELTIETGDRWETAQWSAHTLLLTRSESRGCALVQRTIALTVGVAPDRPPTFRLRGRLPVARTPIGDCAEEPRYREETALAGDGEAVRLVLVVDREGEDVVHSEVVARRATPTGWVEQVLLDPAPDRLIDGGSGPNVVLAHRPGDPWIVATGDRVVADGVCTPRPGQRVWTWERDRWVGRDGREALTLLATAGLWRLAGEDGWLLVLAQDDERDQELLDARRRRLARKRPEEPLYTFESSAFPELNPGFVIVAPAPWSDRAGAEAGERPWGGRSTSYVKRAWPAADGCADVSSRSPRG